MTEHSNTRWLILHGKLLMPQRKFSVRDSAEKLHSHTRSLLRCFVMWRHVMCLPLSPVRPAWPNHYLSFVMRHQNDTLQSTGEKVGLYLRLDLPQQLQLPIKNPLFSSFIVSDTCGNNCVTITSVSNNDKTWNESSCRGFLSYGNTWGEFPPEFPSPSDSSVSTWRSIDGT